MILALSPPTKVKELSTFLGTLQYYRDMWKSRSEMLAPSTDLVGKCDQMKVTKEKGAKKAPWHWDDIHQRAFDQVKATICQDVVPAYPDFSKPFAIYTDASATQLGAVITQNNRTLAFFSRKISDSQKQYSVTEI